MSEEKRFAILIDADNISADYIKTILDEVSNKGIATYKRIYGDWTKAQLESWKKVLLDYSITPMQQYAYTIGKNATDSAMIIDAMDILYSEKVEGFCLVTSDSDFTKLASRLREAGKMVIGMGEEKTPRPFISACNEFKFIDKLTKEAEELSNSEKVPVNIPKDEKKKEQAKDGKKAQQNKNTQPSKDTQTIKEAQPSKNETSVTDIETIKSTIIKLINENSDDDGWMRASDIGTLLPKRYADFDVRNYGQKKMTLFLKSLKIFEIDKRKDPESKKNPNSYITYVRIKELGGKIEK